MDAKVCDLGEGLTTMTQEGIWGSDVTVLCLYCLGVTQLRACQNS